MTDPLISDELSDEPSDFGSLRPGTRLGRYELLVPIARGGMARVWAARQHGTRGFQKLVAIKTILPHLAEEPEFERMFLDEARIASGVHHPNVCEIYELGEERRTLYLAMEWVNGDSFSRALRISGKVEPVDFGVAARIIADACAGAHAAHELEDDDGHKQNVVHRDLSPHNILVNWDGFTKVCDFGVAKALNQLHEVTSAGQLKGKISYMSPEQVTGETVDRRSDIFSLGCVLYEATVGRRPFRGEGDHNVMQAIVNGQFDPPSAIIRNYPRDLERVVVRSLAHVPNQRFASAELMRYALEEYLQKSGTLVTQSHVAAVIRTRLGEMLEKRRDRIKRSSKQGEEGEWSSASVPSSREPVDHRSGVQTSRAGIPPTADSAPTEPTNFGRVPPHLRAAIEPSSSSTIPQAPQQLIDSLAQARVRSTLGADPPEAGRETPQLGVPRVKEPKPELPRREEATSSNQIVIEQAIKSSLVPGAPSSLPPSSPLNPSPMDQTKIGPASVPPRQMAAQPQFRDAPIPIMQHGFEGPPSMPPAGFAASATDEPHGRGVGQYALAALVGLLFACAIGGAGFYYWKARQQLAVAPPPAVTTVMPTAATPTAPMVVPSAMPDVPVRNDPATADAKDAGAPATAGSAKKTKKKDRDPNALPDNPY